MKIKTSFTRTIPRDDIEDRAQARRLARETAAINRHAAKLNAEMADALSFQAAANP